MPTFHLGYVPIRAANSIFTPSRLNASPALLLKTSFITSREWRIEERRCPVDPESQTAGPTCFSTGELALCPNAHGWEVGKWI